MVYAFLREKGGAPCASPYFYSVVVLLLHFASVDLTLLETIEAYRGVAVHNVGALPVTRTGVVFVVVFALCARYYFSNSALTNSGTSVIPTLVIWVGLASVNTDLAGYDFIGTNPIAPKPVCMPATRIILAHGHR